MIPARGGSKRIPRKNIKNFNGKPLIAWTINHAIESKLFDQIFVSTDDSEIAAIAKTYGASIAKLRDANLSNDHATLIEVMQSEAEKLIADNFNPMDSLCCLYPASPMLNFKKVQEGIMVVNEKKADFAIAIKEFEQSPMRALAVNEAGLLQYKFPQNAITRTQDLETLFTDAGQFTIATIGKWAQTNTTLEGRIFPIKIGKYEAIDIDDLSDWKFAEEIFKIRKELSHNNDEAII